MEEIFRSQIEPLYGNQDEALRKIRDRTDGRCEVLLYNDSPVGFVVYKKEKQREHEREGLADSFEVKSLVIIEPSDRTRETYGTMLVNRVMKLAQRNFAKNLYMTVSESDQKMVEFLRSKGFSVGKTWQDKYIKGVKEFLFQLNVPEKGKGMIQQSESEPRVEEKEVSRKRERSRSRERDRDRDLERQERKKDRDDHDTASNGLSRKRNREERSSDRESAQAEDYQRKKRETEVDYQRSRELGSLSFRGRGRGFDHSRGRGRAFSESTSSRAPFYSEKRGCHELTLRKKYIHQIKSGRKTIEGRINSGIVLRYRSGDQIRFFYQQDPSDDALCDITDIRKYGSFREMLQQEGYQKCLTDVRSLEEAVRVYDQIPGYAERAAKFGVVAIQLNLKR
ncbi:MAG: GNAT family N-acetyltransferase [Halobacteriovoraceae bacterium]|nr:GNAT family N-acetyltransferase [Halobacteriovoraceae bacterium]